MLEPGNALRFLDAGQPFPFAHEFTRILGATFIGMLATPLLIPFRQTAVAGVTAKRLSEVGIFIAGNAGIAFGLIVVSCVLAAWWFQRQLLPSLSDINIELTANWSLVGFAVFALAFALGRSREPGRAVVDSAEKMLIREGRDTRLVDPDAILWIESKGNQIVIHEKDRSHLTRRALSEFVDELDASDFFRIHRRMVVALRAVVSIGALANGDAEARLSSGRSLKVSRRNRRAFQEAWANFHGR